MRWTVLPGDQFGQWTVLDTSDRKSLCKCSCGTEKWLFSFSLVNDDPDKRSTQCRKCANDELQKRRKRIARDIPRAKYNRMRMVVKNAIRRCTDPTEKRYEDYGGRGIKVFQEWLDDKRKFILYISQLPGSDDRRLVIDRINNDGHYEPGNLRFASQSVSNTNKRPRKTGYTTSKRRR